jgi:hypothetical protein
VCRKKAHTRELRKGIEATRGKNPPPQRNIRAFTSRLLAAGGNPTLQGQGGGPGCLRPRHSRCNDQPTSPFRVEAPPKSAGCQTISQHTVLENQCLSARQELLPILHAEDARLGVDTGPRYSRIKGRSQSLGEHRYLLHRLQPPQRRYDARASRASTRSYPQTTDLPTCPKNHLEDRGSTGELARLPLLARLTFPYFVSKRFL